MSMMESAFARKISTYVKLSDDDLVFLSDLDRRKRTIPAGLKLLQPGQPQQPAFIVARGWVCSYQSRKDGRRQIVDVRIPGDFLGLRSTLFRATDLTAEPITEVEVIEVPAKELLETFQKTPRLATAVLWAASRDEALVVEHLVDLKLRGPSERMARFLLQLNDRLRLVSLGTHAGFGCPLTHVHLAEALGLSAIQVKDVLDDLHRRGLCSFVDGEVTFDDYEGMVSLAQVDRHHLEVRRPLLI